MDRPIVKYDEISDALIIAFEVGKRATGIELNDQVLLRIDKDRRKAVGIIIFDYSVVAQRMRTELPVFSLDGLDDLSEETREIVFEILSKPPVNEFLSIAGNRMVFKRSKWHEGLLEVGEDGRNRSLSRLC